VTLPAKNWERIAYMVTMSVAWLTRKHRIDPVLDALGPARACPT
jgi:hypothetical protein